MLSKSSESQCCLDISYRTIPWKRGKNAKLLSLPRGKHSSDENSPSTSYDSTKLHKISRAVYTRLNHILLFRYASFEILTSPWIKSMEPLWINGDQFMVISIYCLPCVFILRAFAVCLRGELIFCFPYSSAQFVFAGVLPLLTVIEVFVSEQG